jgi:hypothetical protein
MAAFLQKKFTMERLPYINMECTVGAILRLNGAGRRYLVQDGSSVSKGIEVLSRVSNDTNYEFMHLLENPILCDRRAVEMVVAAGESNSGSSNPTVSNGVGKIDFPSIHLENKAGDVGAVLRCYGSFFRCGAPPTVSYTCLSSI